MRRICIMNKYQVKLYSKIAGDDDATAWIAFLVNTPMTEKQLKVYYEFKSLSISDVEVLEVL
jgi:hypothetical protein